MNRHMPILVGMTVLIVLASTHIATSAFGDDVMSATIPLMSSGAKEIGGEGFIWSDGDDTFLILGGYSGIFVGKTREHQLVGSASIMGAGDSDVLLFDLGYIHNLLGNGKLYFGLGVGGLTYEQENFWGPSETKTDFLTYLTGGFRFPLTNRVAARLSYKARFRDGTLHELRAGLSYFTMPWF